MKSTLDLQKVAREYEKTCALFDKDIPTLWEYAQQQLIAALVQANTKRNGKKERTPRKPERILRIYEEYLAQLLDGCFRWREKNPREGISIFLERMPPFSFTAVTEPLNVTNLFFARLDADVLADCLQEKLAARLGNPKGDYTERMRERIGMARRTKKHIEYKKKKRACIQEAIKEVFDPALAVSRELMDAWIWSSVENIAQGFSVLKNGISPSSLKRHGRPEYRKVTKPQFSYPILLRVMEGSRHATREFRENLLRLQKRVLPSYRSPFLPSKGPPP